MTTRDEVIASLAAAQQPAIDGASGPADLDGGAGRKFDGVQGPGYCALSPIKVKRKMPYAMFHERFPKIAERETRTVSVFGHSDQGLPPGDYSLLEMYCNEKGCDCRRVFLCVVSSFRKDVEAVVAYGWETPKFYAKWMGDDDPDSIRVLKGPALNLGSPESELAPAILELVGNVVLRDTAYVERLKAHYTMFRGEIDRKPTVPSKKNQKKKTRKRRRKT